MQADSFKIILENLQNSDEAQEKTLNAQKNVINFQNNKPASVKPSKPIILSTVEKKRYKQIMDNLIVGAGSQIEQQVNNKWKEDDTESLVKRYLGSFRNKTLETIKKHVSFPNKFDLFLDIMLLLMGYIYYNKSNVDEAISKVKDTFDSISGPIYSSIQKFYDVVSNYVSKLVDSVLRSLKSLMKLIQKLLTPLYEKIKETIKRGLGRLRDALLKSLFQVFTDFLKTLKNLFSKKSIETMWGNFEKPIEYQDAQELFGQQFGANETELKSQMENRMTSNVAFFNIVDNGTINGNDRKEFETIRNYERDALNVLGDKFTNYSYESRALNEPNKNIDQIYDQLNNGITSVETYFRLENKVRREISNNIFNNELLQSTSRMAHEAKQAFEAAYKSLQQDKMPTETIGHALSKIYDSFYRLSYIYQTLIQVRGRKDDLKKFKATEKIMDVNKSIIKSSLIKYLSGQFSFIDEIQKIVDRITKFEIIKGDNLLSDKLLALFDNFTANSNLKLLYQLSPISISRFRQETTQQQSQSKNESNNLTSILDFREDMSNLITISRNLDEFEKESDYYENAIHDEVDQHKEKIKVFLSKIEEAFSIS